MDFANMSQVPELSKLVSRHCLQSAAKPQRIHSNSGFTLIELVVVIVILGILAATALPKFQSMQSDARLAHLKQLQGSLRTTASQIRALCAVQYEHCRLDAPYQILVPGTSEVSYVEAMGTKFLIHYGWPTSFPYTSYESLIESVSLTNITVVPYVTGSYIRELRLTDAPDPTTCKLVFGNSIWTVTGSPTYTITSTGC